MLQFGYTIERERERSIVSKFIKHKCHDDVRHETGGKKNLDFRQYNLLLDAAEAPVYLS